MTLAFLYPRGECDPNPEHRQDTLELLQRRRAPGGGNVVDEPHKSACPDQIAHLDPRRPQPLVRGSHKTEIRTS